MSDLILNNMDKIAAHFNVSVDNVMNTYINAQTYSNGIWMWFIVIIIMSFIITAGIVYWQTQEVGESIAMAFIVAFVVGLLGSLVS